MSAAGKAEEMRVAKAWLRSQPLRPLGDLSLWVWSGSEGWHAVGTTPDDAREAALALVVENWLRDDCDGGLFPDVIRLVEEGGLVELRGSRSALHALLGAGVGGREKARLLDVLDAVEGARGAVAA